MEYEDEILDEIEIREYITLDEGLIHPTITKIETIFNINGRFVAFSNYFDTGYSNNSMDDFKESIQLNTLRLLKDKKYMKVIKRIFAQEKNFYKNNKMLNLIFDFLTYDENYHHLLCVYSERTNRFQKSIQS